MYDLVSEEEDQVRSATRLDKRIRLLTGSINDSLVKLQALIEEAKQGQIHQALGFASWTAYLADVFVLPSPLDRSIRTDVVRYLAGEGMSQRAIASVTGAAKTTVQRDLEEQVDAGGPNGPGDHESSCITVVTGLDGKTYPKPSHGQQNSPKKKRKPPTPQPRPEEVLPLIVSTLGAVAVACHLGRPDLDVAEPYRVQHVATILDCLDSIYEAVRQWEVTP